MKTIYFLLLTTVFFVRCEDPGIQPSDDDTNEDETVFTESPLPGYTLAWADEFDAAVLDTDQWKYRIGASHESYQRSENVVLEDGRLVIYLKREDHMGKSLTGGGIITNTQHGYGYYEVSAKMDGGWGWHEAFWTAAVSGFDDPNPMREEGTGRHFEIDCFEHYGQHGVNEFTYGTIDRGPYHTLIDEVFVAQGPINRDFVTDAPDLTADYYTYGFEYTPDYLNYYFNGELLKTVDMRKAPKHDFYIWLSCIATYADATDAGKVYFDYIRAYTISPADYKARKGQFIDYLDGLRGPASNGTDLWIEAEDFVYSNNWIIERDIEQTKVLKGFTLRDPNRGLEELTARTDIIVNEAGHYKLWVRSRDFDTQQGSRRFKVLVNGEESAQEFGTHGVNGYAWQPGGTFILSQGINTFNLFDLSQYHARCDRILLTTDMDFVPELLGGFANVEHSADFMGLQPFGENNIVAVRIGDGTVPLVLGSAHKVFLDEYTPTGTLVRSIGMPTVVEGKNRRLTLSVSTTDHTEGYLSLSPDGRYLALAGYDAEPGLGNVVSTSGYDVNRVVALINKLGFTDVTTALPTIGNAPVRSAVVANGRDIWVTGGRNGIRYATRGIPASTDITATGITGRSLSIFEGQLYASSTASGYRVMRVGEGLPTTAGQELINLPGIPDNEGSPYDIYMVDLNPAIPGPDVLYVADQWSPALSKYSLVGGVWILNGRIGAAADQYRGLTGRVISSGVELFATRKNAGSTQGGGEIVRLVDSGGYNGAFNAEPQVIVSTPLYTLFRGIALTPQ